MISIIIPIYNKRDNVLPLHEKLSAERPHLDRPFEVVFVDYGSSDGSGQPLLEVTQRDKRFKLVSLRRNFGQTAAMMAGIDFAQGDIIVPMDSDLQNDPADIRRLVEKLDEGYDVVSG